MGKSEEKQASNKEERSEIEIYYDRTPSYRTYHVDGMRGGLSTSGNLTLDFYVERTAAPQVVTRGVDKSGQLGEVVDAGGERSGLVRESEGGIVMDIETAAQVYDWLGGTLKNAFQRGALSREAALEAGIIKEDSNDE